MKEKESNIVLAVVIVLVILLFFGGFGMMGFWGAGMISGFFGGFGFMWIFGWMITILILVALILFILWLVKQLQGGKKKNG
ncbi:hypothetical protein J4217_02995 [Candidatus Pacearchaeota archaeon]|nr:hypothetical protein [Candidatus Pacearchaeota archaeon]